jgi:hypothetical protein
MHLRSVLSLKAKRKRELAKEEAIKEKALAKKQIAAANVILQLCLFTKDLLD